MAKVNLTTIGTLTPPASAIASLNANVTELARAIDTLLSRDGQSPNQMEAELDMNSQKILNVADPEANHDAVNLESMQAAIAGALFDGATVIIEGDATIRTDLSNGAAGYGAELVAYDSVYNVKERLDNIELAGGGDPTLRADLVAGTGASIVGFTQSGTGADARTMQSKAREQASVLDFIPPAEHAAILAGTSTYDCTADVQAAITAHKRCLVPGGQYLISGAISIPTDHTLEGVGYSTVFARAGANLSFFILATGATIKDMKLSRSGATEPTSGRLIDVAAGACNISGIFANDCWDGIYISGCAGLFMERIYINNWRNAGINVAGSSNDLFLDQFILSNIGSSAGVGIRLWNMVEAFTASNGDVIGGSYAMSLGADEATFSPYTNRVFPQFNKFTNLYLDSSVNGVSIEKGTENTFVNCWFSSSSAGNGCVVGLNYNTTFSACNFYGNNGSGLLLSNTSQKYTKVLGCSATNNNLGNSGQNGITVNAGVGNFIIKDCTASNISPGTLQATGIWVGAGASDNYIIAHNICLNNAATGVTDGGTGVNKVVGGNIQ